MAGTPSDRARAIILSGEPFYPIEVSRQLRRSDGFGNQIKNDLARLGYVFSGTRPGPYKCENPDHQPSAEQVEGLREFRREMQGKSPSKRKPLVGGGGRAGLSPEELARVREMDRMYKARSKAKRGAAENGGSSTGMAIQSMDLARAEPPQGLERHEPVPNHGPEHFNGNGILGIPGFERAEPMNYRATLNSIPPALASGVQVFAMALQDNGTLRLGIQNGERKWVVDVVAEIAR